MSVSDIDRAVRRFKREGWDKAKEDCSSWAWAQFKSLDGLVWKERAGGWPYAELWRHDQRLAVVWVAQEGLELTVKWSHWRHPSWETLDEPRDPWGDRGGPLGGTL